MRETIIPVRMYLRRSSVCSSRAYTLRETVPDYGVDSKFLDTARTSLVETVPFAGVSSVRE
jgi:rRNA maturation protein Nop10